MINTKTTVRKEGHRCPMCAERILDEDSWEKHVIECGRKRREKRFECSRCDYAKNKKSDMQRHERTRHSGSSGFVEVQSDSDREWEALDPGSLSDMVGELDTSHAIPITPEVTKRKPTRPLPEYTPKAKAIVGAEAMIPTAPSHFHTPETTPRERNGEHSSTRASATLSSSYRDFATQTSATPADACTQTLPLDGLEAGTQTESGKKRRLHCVQKSYQVDGQSVVEIHENEV
ncbi:uncharacterized protein LOC133179736 [Saccostrea echinata]|uniref:uncharacterized protein LOC133179736 n=1 Tax=Saccostrea echinata TaxID=191078 RepID=UPI002A83DED4|nr:uncharacterized protein LOC133179736 [Saccostrea echinata]